MRKVILGLVLLLPVGLLFMTGGVVQQAQADPQGCGPPDLSITASGLTSEQSGNAAAIVTKGRELGVSERGWVIAVATAYQESHLVNVDHGDIAGPDSRGLFQQRDSWGPLTVRMDPSGAAGLFYAALLKIPGWETLPLAQAAQAVQHSQFPGLYARWETLAEGVVEQLGGTVPVCSGQVTDGWALPLPKNLINTPTSEHHDYPAVDLPVAPGTPVFAMTPGKIALVEEPGGCGHGIQIVNGPDTWLYCHLAAQDASPGSQIGAGDQIGSSGFSGDVRPPGPGGAHLHVQLRRSGVLTCINEVVNELAAGRPAPTVLSTSYPCLH